MFKKLCLSLAMLSFMGLGATQLMASFQILPDQACCASTWGNATFLVATIENGRVDCIYLMPDYSVIHRDC